MIAACRQLLNSLTYKDSSVRRAAVKLIRELGTELEDGNYEMGAAVEDALALLTDAMTQVDEDVEDIDQAIKEARESGDDDEYEEETSP